jgi:hypothetical protein
MSWRQLWESESGEEAGTDWAGEFKAYWIDRFKEAYVKARVRVEAILFLVFLSGGFFILDRTMWLVGFVLFALAFLFELCFICSFNHAKTLEKEIATLQDRVKSEITVSCDDEQCTLPPSQTTHGLFRVIVHLGGADLITNVKARIEALRKDGKKLTLREPVRLRFHSADASGELKTMSAGTGEPLDMLRLEHVGALSLALAWNYANFDRDFCNEPDHTYEMDVSISSSIFPTKFTYVCPWTGDFNTTKPYIKQLG